MSMKSSDDDTGAQPSLAGFTISKQQQNKIRGLNCISLTIRVSDS